MKGFEIEKKQKFVTLMYNVYEL